MLLESLAIPWSGYFLPKLACFVLYLKIIDTFLKMKYVSYNKLFKELKIGTEILLDQAVFKL